MNAMPLAFADNNERFLKLAVVRDASSQQLANTW